MIPSAMRSMPYTGPRPCRLGEAPKVKEASETEKLSLTSFGQALILVAEIYLHARICFRVSFPLLKSSYMLERTV
jgi:hypothetical protein